MSMISTVYLVVQAKGGWAVNNGADTVSFHRQHADAAERARQMSHEAADVGELASVLDIEAAETDDDPH